MKKIVTIGGGTGHFALLSGLKEHPVHLSAVVSMADDGGSTGVLRDELGVLPPGDVRQCLVALSESSLMLRELMNYRFEEGSLKGHSFGNIFLSALEKTSGSFSRGVEEAMRILNVKGEVIPVTEENVCLHVALENGAILKGETAIDHGNVQSGIKRIFYSGAVRADPRVLARIAAADLIVIGPGNHYCSILTNLIIHDVAKAINKSHAKVVYVANLINKKYHTDAFTVDDYVQSVEQWIGKNRIDYVIYNRQQPPEPLVEKYALLEGGTIVEFHPEKNPARKYKLIEGDFISQHVAHYSTSDVLAATARSFIRHEPAKLARAIVSL